MPDDDLLAALAKALAHPARIHILRLLLATPDSICGDIVDAFGLAQSTVCEHLRILKSARVITGAISGPRICYVLNTEAFSLLAEFVPSLKPPANYACCAPQVEAAP